MIYIFDDSYMNAGGIFESQMPAIVGEIHTDLTQITLLWFGWKCLAALQHCQ